LADDLLSFLKQWDRPRYLALLLMPENKQQDILALYAFNAELDRIPLLVSDPQIGEIRFQWWLDTLEAMEQGEISDHPTAAALTVAIKNNALPFPALRNMIEARTRLLYADRPENIEELEAYLGNTSSALIQLSALVLDSTVAPAAAEAAGFAGVALGISDILAEPKRFANLVPKDWSVEKLAKHGLSRLTEARRSSLQSSVFPAFLTAALAESQILKPNQRLSPLRAQWLLWRVSRRKKF
jgi:15-cis-phytoene synthase